MKTLFLPVKREYFEQIKSGEKTQEFRLVNDYWRKRLEGLKEPYGKLIIALGYTGDPEKRLEFTYRGWTKKTITHKHFGQEPVEVYAIHLTEGTF